MTNLNESFKSSLLAFVSEAAGDNVTDIITYEEDTAGDGYCETCYFEWTVVDVTYKNDDGDVKSYQYRGDFMELVNELLSYKA